MNIDELKGKIIYQIYPRSFNDSNDDGIGDIQGIISKLDYLTTLNIDYIWLSPIYQSPNYDNGYDISDYLSINPEYGTMEDFNELVQECNNRGIGIVMDLVINHTSNQHPWFIQSKDITSKYHNYYVWKEPGLPNKNYLMGTPPNNWGSFFGGTAWTYDSDLKKYYLHLFAKEQPDLNWDNEEVYQEIKKILQFWCEKGIAGFRCDVINLLGKTDYQNSKVKFPLKGIDKFVSTPKTHAILQRLRKDVFNKYNVFTVGESAFVNIPKAHDLIDKKRKELDMLFYFEHMEVDSYVIKWFHKGGNFPYKKFFKKMFHWSNEFPNNAIYLENHDQIRIVSKLFKKYNPDQSKALSTLLLTLKGIPFVYQGQEIGMTNTSFKNIDEIKDVESKTVYSILTNFWLFKIPLFKGIPFKMVKRATRDHARTPMQWDDSKNAGFSEADTTWLNVNPNYEKINVESEQNDPNSPLTFFQRLSDYRLHSNALINGEQVLHINNGKLLVFERKASDQTIYVAINLTNKKQRFVISGKLELTSLNEKRTQVGKKLDMFVLDPYESILVN
jgi:oligo-1,6-glucosidase